MDLPQSIRTFVVHAGEMGARWGISRLAGRVFGLLFLSSEPLNADDLSARLGISRSSVSLSLKELRAWRLVERQPMADDRREHYAAPTDIRVIFGILAEERRRQEIVPTLAVLRQGLKGPAGGARFARDRLRQMHDLLMAIAGEAMPAPDGLPRPVRRRKARSSPG